MATPALCTPCDMTFPSEEAFQAHKASGHTTVGKPIHEPIPPRITLDQAQQLEKLDKAKTPSKKEEPPKEEPPTELPPGVPADALPTAEFMEAVKRIEGDPPPDPTAIAEHKAEMQKIIDQKVAEDKRPPLPIKLTYQYIGECPKDKSPVTTLEIDIDNKHFVVAYCEEEKKQLQDREVVKL